ncbi:protein-methionine sulfoxide oxidase mical3a-like isoform X26 [Brienomyrus brachyistius]|uniref:protein-methionine sulfoxide oxidase mical3a-like isoform X26 n=1 Tax=Brienomyrus brachyistius TaxID=42636 RepID=UPI0020B3B9AD|nr:protein-methionine sulfoxide oxidase mical3a-like isoform X26 [Brienomyrus brachyistius]
MGDGGVGNGGESVNQSHVLFDRFVQATTCKGTLRSFQELCDFLELKPSEYRIFYHKLKSRLNYWKAKALWAKLDKRASHKDYKKGRACTNSRCLIIGAGPCGLRTAIELSFLGAKVVLLEKRDAFSRNNVLHLWPFTIQDLRGLGAKKFYGKFCAGAIDHISIRQLQLILLKVALLLGIEIHVNVEFKGLVEPPEDQENERIGWRAEVSPGTHPVNELEFDVVIGADGRRNTLPGFRRKEFRGKLAIAITANFINRNTTAEAKVEEISGVAFIFNQKFFQDLREATGIDLENIVYYKDDTHYFVMTAKKQSLLEKGVILHDHADTELLLSRGNVDQAALLAYAREAADFSTNHQLPTLDFAINHYGQPDVAMFDFTCMYASENAALVRQRNGHQLLVALVGDSLLEPFWPMGTGIARGFLAALDSAWMVRSWSQGTAPLEVLAERETIYRLLPQTTPENVSKNFSQYSVDPTTRYPNINLHSLRPNQVRHLIDTGECRDPRIDMENAVNALTPKLTRHEYGQLENILEDSIARSSKLLSWCQRQTQGYRNVSVTDLTTSWKSGLALCAIIHRYRPDLIDFDSLEERDLEKNNQLAFDVAEQEFGISPIMTGKEMSSVGEPDKLSMVMYLSQFYEMFKDTVPPGDNNNLSPEDKAALIASTKSPISFLSKLGQSITRKRNPKDQKEKELEGKRRRTSLTEDEGFPRVRCEDRHGLATALTERRVDAVAGGNNNNKVKSMASQLLAKFEENAPVPSSGLKRQARSCSSSRSCPKKIILLSSSSSTSSSPSLHAQEPQLPLEDHTATYTPNVCLASRLKDKPEKPQPMRKPPRSFLEQWYQSRGLSPGSPSLSHDYLCQESHVPPSEDQVSLHIPSVKERATCLASALTDKPEKPQPFKKPSCFFIERWHLSRGLRSARVLSSSNALRQSYIKMYTGGVSSLAQQLANQLQNQEEPKPFLNKKDLCSLRKEFPQNIGGSDVCYFCHRRVYVMERLSAEGKFFHRSCFKCDYCGTTLRLSSYAFDLEDGKFYCKPHYCYRLSGQAQRKRPAPTAPLITKENKVTPSAPNAVDSTGRAMATVSPGELRPPVAEVNGVLEACLAKRPRGTPERIELENYRLSLQREEELEEVPEETLAEHNLSSALDKVTDAEEASSSESEMEGEEEEEEEPEQHGQHPGARGSKRAAWEETPQPEENLAEVGPPDMGEAGPKGDREEEEQDEEEEEDIEEESSDEGEYCPWEMELHSGLWLESLVDEEDTGTFKARNLRIQQALQPVDPLADAHPGPVQAEGPQGGASAKASGPSLCTVPAPPSARHEIVRAWLDSLPGDAYEDALEEEAKSMDADEGPDVFEDDIPSDAEAEARLHQLEAGDPLQEDEEKSVSHGRVSSLVQSSIGPIQMDGDDVVVESQLETIQEFQSPYSLATSSMHFFPEPYVEDTTKPDVYVPDTSAKQSPVAPGSPIHSQLEPLPDAVTTKSPTKQFFACSPAGNPLSPICTQPLPVDESVRTQSEDSPVRTQPVPTIASTPLPSSPKEKAQEPSLPNTTTSPVKRSDIIEEFWMKSAEIRKSLGLTPLERSSGPQKRFSVPFDLLSSRLHTPDEVPDESKPLFSSCSPIHRLNITVEGRVVSPVDKEPKTIGSVKRALSSSSGLGLNGSPTTSQTLNTSDSAMLTPPSSPPPPPPNEEPATLRHKKHQVGWNNPSEPAEPITRSPQTPGPSPGPDKPPVPSPTHENFKPTAMLVPALRTKPISAVVRRENTKRKSFVESVEEIPFADDVEDQSDARTPNTSQKEKFYTPPTSRPQKERPPMNLALGVENGTPKRHRDISEFSPEAKGIAEERMRAREKNIKSQALKDAMAMHLTKMKEMDAPNASSKAAWNVSSDSEGKTEYTSVVLSPPNVLEAKVLDSQRFADTLPARLPSNSGNQTQDGNQSVEGSAASSESSAGGKIKKRSSIFSPRKSKKEKKAKSEGRSPDKHSQEDLPKHKSIWKTVFSGYKKEKRKKDDKSLPSTPSSASAVDSEKKRTSPLNRASDVQLRRNLSFSEDSDLSCDDVLEKSSQRSKADSVNVPHALALKRGYAIKRTYTEEELNAKLTRRVQKAARRQAKQEELKRLHRAQIIQRQLEQVEEKQRQLEERGVAVEKALRGEAVEPPLRIPRRRPFSFCPCCVTEGMGKKDDPRLMQEWFKLVQEKNALVRYESELMIFARELELEDRQSRLQQELRERMAVDDHLKSEEELLEERQILNEMLEVVEQRDSLVALLEEQRLREKEEDRDLEAVMLSKGFNLNWA